MNSLAGTNAFRVPQIIRGSEILEDVECHRFAVGSAILVAPDLKPLLSQLNHVNYEARQSLHDLSTRDIINFLSKVGAVLRLAGNIDLQEALSCSRLTSATPIRVLQSQFSSLPELFSKEALAQITTVSFPNGQLDGWHPLPLRGSKASVRAFGANCLHIIAGNSPLIAAATVIRSALCRCDSIVKVPSNDPLTSAAILRAFKQVDPQHPLIHSLSAVYWRGGDPSIEAHAYGSPHLQKVIAWGGSATMASARRHTAPEVDLISFGPKVSASIIDLTQCLEEDEEWLDQLALDVSYMGQEACFNSRLIYLALPSTADPADTLRSVAHRLLERIAKVPEEVRGSNRPLDTELALELEAIAFAGDGSFVVASASGGGLMVCSPFGVPVEFYERLHGCVANLVAITSASEALNALSRKSQTVGVYPPKLRHQLRDAIALQGAQRIVALGMASHMVEGAPHDSIEPMRRLCNWIVEQGQE